MLAVRGQKRLIQQALFNKYIHIYPNGFSISTTLTMLAYKQNWEINYISIITPKRSGKSSMRIIKDGFRTLLLIIRIISLFNPLKIFIPISLFLFLFGTLFSGYGLWKYSSFPKTGIIILITSVLIFTFGIISDLLSLVNFKKKDI